jgi:outer membrane protein W
MRHLYAITIIIALLIPNTSNALFTEVGISGSYKKSMLDEGNYEQTQSGSLSISFYFWEQTALELSYTSAHAYQKVTNSSTGDLVLEKICILNLPGLDFVLAFADRKAQFQPYVKAGGAYVIKKLQVTTDPDLGKWETEVPAGLSPSAGIGLKLRFSQQLL